MARYRKIDIRIHNDEKFRALSDNAQLLFFRLLTHPHMTALGAMRATVDGLASEYRSLPKAFREAFGELLAKGMVKHDPEACFLWLPNFLKYNGPESPNVVKSWASALDLLPECSMYRQLIQHVKAFTEGLPEAFGKALPEAFAKGMPNQEQEQEQEEEIARSDSEPESSSPPVILFPVVGNGSGSEYPVTAEQAAEWAESYPAVDVLAELREMRSWLISNPTRKKTARGVPRFVNAWLSRAQDRGRTATNGQRGIAALGGVVL